MSSGGDGIYCRVFIVRERRETLSSHLALAWKGTQNLSAPSQGGRRGGRAGPRHSRDPRCARHPAPFPRPFPPRRGWLLGPSAT